MTKRVVDVLEGVEIERRNGHRTGRIAGAFPQYAVDIVAQADTVGKTRQLVEMSQLPEPLLGYLPFRDIPAEEEVFLLGLGPHARPCQGNDPSAFVKVPRFEVTDLVAGPGQLHFAAGTCKILRIDEFRGAMPVHFIRPIAEGRQRAWTYPPQISLSIGNQDQIQRRFEQPALFFRLVVQGLRLLVDIRVRIGAFLRGERKPSQHEEAEHRASGDDVHHLRNNQVRRITQYADDGGRKKSVLRAKVQTEIQV